jgi:hypothetical protein
MAQKKPKTFPTPEGAGDRKLLADVKQFGWHVIKVATDDEGPAFAYSIGMYHSFEHPEIVTFGLDVTDMHRMINAIGEAVRSGSRFSDCDESDAALEGYNVRFRRVDLRHYCKYFGYARWFYQGDEFPVLQCLWPDSKHRYPGNRRFDANLKGLQLVLYVNEP